MKAIMVDIEGLSLIPHQTRMLQLAAAHFDFESGETLNEFNMFFSEEMKDRPHWTTDDPSTLKFWLSQPNWPQMLASVKRSGVYWKYVMDCFRKWVEQCTFPGEAFPLVFACGPQYDIVVIDEYYRQLHEPSPWPFSKVRDYRTIRETYGEWLQQDDVCFRGNHFADKDVEAQVKTLLHIHKNYSWVPR